MLKDFFVNHYDIFVNYGPIITITCFLGFYGILILFALKERRGTKGDRIAFSVLLVALTPNFLAHVSMAYIHSTWVPLIAEVANIIPVLIYLLVNEMYISKD